MKKIKLISALFFTLLIIACKKDKCQTCTKTIGGIAGNIVDEIQEVCNDKKAKELEESSSGTTVWKCELL